MDESSQEANGKIDDTERLSGKIECAFGCIGNNKLRGGVIDRLENAGHRVSTLNHPTGYVSKTANIGRGMVVEPRAI